MQKADYDYNDLVMSNMAVTGENNANFLVYQLRISMRKARQIDIIVSFLMESGVKLLVRDLDEAISRGVKVRLLTGNYLGITQPAALFMIRQKFGDKVDLRFYNDPGRSFHPKAYFFHYDNYSDIFVGSSNVSQSALTSGIEWNYRFSDTSDPINYKVFERTFEDLFFNHSIVIDDTVLREYSKNWHRPLVSKDIEKYDDSNQLAERISELWEPRGAQIEALYALDCTRAEGATKGLVQAATGVGKTYLAAFDSQKFRKVLFVAHREEILKQAAESFHNVRKDNDYGFFNKNEKCCDKSVIFASVATLGRDDYLNDGYFKKDYFDYIVIDEFHHAVNDQYMKIINYFKPKFLLGLTATPDRMDGKNIYEICDYNVPYEITLREAINKGILVPFRYYGVYDDTDYSKLHLVRGKYDEKELNETYIGNTHRHDLIYKYYMKYESKRALGFCCSRQHAEEMASEFNKRGIPSVSVYSNANGEFSEDRAIAINKLKSGDINVIFSVDMFNEGVDITNVDMVMFLRPTESPIVFMQQLGRGLRKSKGKEYLKVLDFIGNYEKAGRIRSFLSDSVGGEPHRDTHGIIDLPDDCQVDFDLRLIDLFDEMDKKGLKAKELIKSEFYRIEAIAGRRPTRMDMFTYMDDEIYEYCMVHRKDNIFKGYMEFLNSLDQLSNDELKIYNSIGREFLQLIENTTMTKVYKMPVLMAFMKPGEVKMEVTEQELMTSWKSFFNTGTNWKDLKTGITYSEYILISDKAHLSNIMKNPVHFLIESGKGFFIKKGDYPIALTDDIKELANNRAFADQFEDIINYRAMDYYRRRYHGSAN